MSDRHPLVEVADRVREESKRGPVAVVFDLDSTLFSVSPRTEAILRALAADPQFATDFALEAEVLRDIEVRPTDWGVRQALERRTGPRPTGAIPPVFLRVRDFWRENFFSNAYLDHDTIYPSADEYVRRLRSLGAEIFYLTGRGERAMREGTLRGLAKHGFPLVSESHLIMKPSDVVTDESFKAVVLKDLQPRFDHVWLFENEPLIIEHVRRDVPLVKIVFMDSVHAGRAEAPSSLPRIGMSYREGLE